MTFVIIVFFFTALSGSYKPNAVMALLRQERAIFYKPPLSFTLADSGGVAVFA